MLVRIVAFVFLVVAILGCGASLRFEDQSAAYFEYCHAAERDPRLGDEAKIACWEAFLESWAMESDKRRMFHAQRRIAALQKGEEHEGSLGEDVQSSISAETLQATVQETVEETVEPSSPATREPAPLPEARQETKQQAAEEAEEELHEEDSRMRSPSSSCDALCEPRYVRCEAKCSGENASDCRAACKAEHRFCQKACA